MKVATVLGTRPEIIRLSEVIKANDIFFDHLLIHTGQNYDYELNQIFFDDLHLRKPDFFLEVARKNLGETLGEIIAKSYAVFEKIQPDAVLILGDTNSSLASIAAKRLHIPIFHMEAGNRCFDELVPEEVNRKLVDHIADINLPYMEQSRLYLLQEGIPRDRIFVTGTPVPEVLEKNLASIKRSQVLERLKLTAGKYFVLSVQREEVVEDDRRLDSLVEAIRAVDSEYGLPIVFGVHPRTVKRLEERKIVLPEGVRQLKPLGFFDYVHLEMNAFCVLSDSGTLGEEAGHLKFPAVHIRQVSERTEAFEQAVMTLGQLDAESILQAIAMERSARDLGLEAGVPRDHRDLNVSLKVVKLIQSWTPYVRRALRV
jgi:UDP-N-acetylglucosamine 2-epimerase (non-hydrolysing)